MQNENPQYKKCPRSYRAILSGNNRKRHASGQIPLDPKTGMLVEGDIQKQTERVMQNIKAVLEEAGTDFSHVIKTTCFLRDMNDFAAFNEVYGTYFTGKPARSCVQAVLPKNAAVEVEVIAVL